jgi:uncharacterized membrane protein (DUF485 family)
LTLLLTVDDSGCTTAPEEQLTNNIIAIAVPVSVAALVVVVVVTLIIAYAVPSLRQKVFPFMNRRHNTVETR